MPRLQRVGLAAQVERICLDFGVYAGFAYFVQISFLLCLDGEDVAIENGTFSWSGEGPPCLKRYELWKIA